MKKFKLKNFFPSIAIFGVLVFLELSFRLINNLNILDLNVFNILIYDLFVSLLLGTITKNLKNPIGKNIILIFYFLLGVLFSVQLCLYKMFNLYFDWSLIHAGNQIISFAGDGLNVILKNIFGIFVFMLPFIINFIFSRRIGMQKDIWQFILIKISLCIILFVVFLCFLNVFKNDSYSSYNLYYNINSNELNIKNFGVINAFLIDTKRQIFGFEEVINNEQVNTDRFVDENMNEEIEYGYNELEIDFDSLISGEKNSKVKAMHEYFKNEVKTRQNEYTGMFKDKNLILFMAESFNEVAVREDITPTLYKLAHNGFVFNNFYTPTISSTIGGEFQELTGLVAASGFLKPWKSGDNAYPFGLARVYQDIGYKTFAYHNHNYTFQNRNKYLSALGFTNFLGCRNGLEKSINCKIWPESDVAMIEATIDDYINQSEPFMVYYATVSGHGDYSFSQSAMARKHKSDVANLNYSEKPLSYLAAQIELNDALELLIEKLEKSGKLDDTVIALVGDHYPYYLSLDEVNEIASYKKDNVVEINHSNFILWNSKMDSVNINKVGSQIDVLPTLYNLFGVSYDSRLIIGKDILSDTPGLAIFGNSSWVSDKGTYYSNSNKFVPKNGVVVADDYVTNVNNIVSNRIAMSKNIMINDYYKGIGE